MARRPFALGFSAALLLAVGVFVGVQSSQHRTADAAPRADAKPFRAGYVSLSELMKDYGKWQGSAKHMEEKRQRAAKELVRMRDLIEQQAKKVAATTDPDDKAALEKEARDVRRKFDDAEAEYKAELDREASECLKELHADVMSMIEKVADERGLDVVYGVPAHPKRAFEQNKGSERNIIDLQLRATAAMPLYMRDEVDITAELVKRLNAKADGEKK